MRQRLRVRRRDACAYSGTTGRRRAVCRIVALRARQRVSRSVSRQARSRAMVVERSAGLKVGTVRQSMEIVCDLRGDLRQRNRELVVKQHRPAVVTPLRHRSWRGTLR